LAPADPVLPAGVVARLGPDVRTVPGMVVASTTRMPTDVEEQRLRARVSAEFARVERGYVSPYPVFLLVIGIASLVVALGSTLAVVGLSAAEGRADVATLAAVGAPPRVRRRLAAAQAGVVAVLGTVLGAVSGIVSGITLVLLSRDRLNGTPDGEQVRQTWQIVMPWWDLGVLAVALPLLAVLAAAAFTRSRLPMVRRLGQ
jgi:putative ABC transport system permease protein